MIEINKKKLVSLASILMILLATTIIGVYAFYQKDADIENRFIAGENKGKITEDFPKGQDLRNPVVKEVSFKNTGDYDQVIRAKYTEIWKDKDGRVISNSYQSSNLINKNWTNHWPEAPGGSSDDLWIYGGDGWFYYKKILPAKKGEESITAPILNSIKLNESLNSEILEIYLEANYKLSFQLEYVQASEAAVNALFGKSCSIEGSNVQWDIE